MDLGLQDSAGQARWDPLRPPEQGSPSSLDRGRKTKEKEDTASLQANVISGRQFLCRVHNARGRHCRCPHEDKETEAQRAEAVGLRTTSSANGIVGPGPSREVTATTGWDKAHRGLSGAIAAAGSEKITYTQPPQTLEEQGLAMAARGTSPPPGEAHEACQEPCCAPPSPAALPLTYASEEHPLLLS